MRLPSLLWMEPAKNAVKAKVAYKAEFPFALVYFTVSGEQVR